MVVMCRMTVGVRRKTMTTWCSKILPVTQALTVQTLRETLAMEGASQIPKYPAEGSQAPMTYQGTMCLAEGSQPPKAHLMVGLLWDSQMRA